MYRISMDEIRNWADSPRRKPMIVRGARQVGKTWLVENALSERFDKIVKIDLEKQPQLHRAFEGDLSPKVVLSIIELYAGKIEKGKTLLFIDEIQECPRAITALRYFYEDCPELHVVAAGSMLEFALGQMSVPVGRVQYLHLGPMTFFEFLLATGKDSMAEAVLEHPASHSTIMTEAINDELRKYFFVGGMPEAVLVYRETLSNVQTNEVHKQILDSYREDFARYRPSVNFECLDAVFLSVARCTGEQLKYTKLYPHTSGVTNRNAFELLCRAKLVNPVHSADPSGLPLGCSIGTRFKASLLDIGLLQSLCGIDPLMAISRDNLLSLYQGKLAEQFVAQELLAWHGEKLYYWSRAARSSNAEVDFLTVCKGKIYPLEVKSGAAGKLKSLHLFLDTYPSCKEGWVLRDGSYAELPDQKLIFWPLYSTPHIGDKSRAPLLSKG